MIQKVYIRQFKKLSDLSQEFNGNLILIKGDNEVGKSSLMQFIQIALGNQKIVPPEAQGGGSVTATIKGRQYEFAVEFKAGKPVVTITAPDGMRSNTKSALAQVVGAVEFDIDEFVEQSKSEKGRKQQIDTFKSFLPEEVRKEINQIEENLKINETERTEIGREVKRLKGAIELHPLRNEPELSVFKPVDLGEVYRKMEEATNRDNLRNRAQSAIEAHNEKIRSNSDRIKALEEEISRLKGENDYVESEIDKINTWLQGNPAIDTTDLKSQIENAEQANQKAAKAAELTKLINELEVQQECYGSRTAIIESSRQMLADIIRDIGGPVDGLTFDEEKLLWNGIPVHPDSLSKSQILELGARLKIAENPELGLLFIPEGESIGEKRFAEILHIAKAVDAQVFMEQVERGNDKLTIEVSKF